MSQPIERDLNFNPDITSEAYRQMSRPGEKKEQLEFFLKQDGPRILLSLGGKFVSFSGNTAIDIGNKLKKLGRKANAWRDPSTG